jgi:hypothetical protein
MGRPVILADVGLDLDDPADAAAADALGVPNEVDPQQGPGRLEGRPGKDLPEIAQFNTTWTDFSVFGTSRPKTL